MKIQKIEIQKMAIREMRIPGRMRKKLCKKIALAACCFALLLCMGGCGSIKDGEDAENTAPEPNTAVEEIIFTAPPDIKISAAGDDGNAITIASGGYNWTYLESEDAAVSAIADSADILAKNSPWETFILPEDAADMRNYTISAARLPDELGITAWDIADVGKTREECSAVETCRYSGEEIEAPDFSVSLQPGRVYEIYMEWDNDKLTENGFCGIAYYALKTSGEASSLTETDNDVLISIDDSFRMTVRKEETQEEMQSDSASFASGFSDILIKYCNLDIVKDENQYTDDSVIYCMQIFDSAGQLVQTIEYTRDYLCIDKIRYRDEGTGTTRELFLAIDSLFQEDFPAAPFGTEDTGTVDVIEGVAMEASYVTPKGIHLVFTNHTDEEYMFGDDYELQVWKDGKWCSVDYIIDNAAFNSIGYLLEGESSAGWDVKWTYFHGILPEGQYRITKTISKETPGSENYRLAAEFYIVNTK